jgi:hypothetical protein
MKTRLRTATIGAAILLAAATARAEQHWIVPAPTIANVKQVWKEGSLRDASEDGRSFVVVESDGHGNPNLAAVRGIAPAADARRRFVSVVLRVHDVSHLANLQVRVGSDSLASSWWAFPIQIFADGEYNFVQEDTWASVTLSFGGAEAAGAPDRAKIDSIGLMVTDDGKGSVAVDFAGAALVDAPEQGVVSFTFDDGYKEHLAAMRLLAEHGWHGTAYVIPQVIGKLPPYMTTDDLAEIAKLGSDVASHDDPPFTQIPAAELEPRIRGIRETLTAWGFGDGAQHLAYPLGKQEPKRVRPTVARIFTTARIAGGGPETFPPADPQLLRATNVVSTTRPEEVAAWARRARDEGEWLILMFHWLPAKTEKPTDYAMADFRRLVDEVAKTKVRVAPVTEVWREVAPQVAARTMFPPRVSVPAAPAP